MSLPAVWMARIRYSFLIPQPQSCSCPAPSLRPGHATVPHTTQICVKPAWLLAIIWSDFAEMAPSRCRVTVVDTSCIRTYIVLSQVSGQGLIVTRHFSTNEKARLCLSTNKSKHRPSDQKFSRQRTESDRISHRFEALRHIFKTFHEAYTIFLSGQRIRSHIGSVSWNIQHILWLLNPNVWSEKGSTAHLQPICAVLVPYELKKRRSEFVLVI